MTTSSVCTASASLLSEGLHAVAVLALPGAMAALCAAMLLKLRSAQAVQLRDRQRGNLPGWQGTGNSRCAEARSGWTVSKRSTGTACGEVSWQTTALLTGATGVTFTSRTSGPSTRSTNTTIVPPTWQAA